MICICQQESCREHYLNVNNVTVPSLYILVLLTHFVKVHQYETEKALD